MPNPETEVGMAPETRHLKITRPAPTGPTAIEIDGHDYASGITSLSIEIGGPNQFTRATIDLAILSHEHDGQAQIWIAAEARRLLLDHGWTPPAEDQA